MPHLANQTWREILEFSIGKPKPKPLRPGSEVKKSLKKGLTLCDIISIGDGLIHFKDGESLASELLVQPPAPQHHMHNTGGFCTNVGGPLRQIENELRTG